MPYRCLNYINGKWVPASGNGTFDSTSPADLDSVVGTVARSSKEDVDAAVAAAGGAFEKWRLTPAPKRAEYLFAVAELLKRNKQRLGELVTTEMGKVLKEGLGDVQEAIDMAYYMAGEGRRLSGETVPSELENKDAKSVRVPRGVFALITPWNFPIAIPSWKIMPCLVAGNTCVFKPAQHAPVCATELVKLFDEAGLPPGVLNMVQGFGSEIGDYLATHRGIDAVSFTGSCEVGMALEGKCASSHKEISTEMGGKNPIIVMDDADLELAVLGVLWGAFGTSGQRCTAASRVIAHERVYEKFTAKLVDAANKLRLGNGLEKNTDVGPVVNGQQYRKVLEYIEIGKQEGAKLLCGGKGIENIGGKRGYWVKPTVFSDVTPSMRIAQEEIFGPVASVIKAGSLKEAIEIANGVAFGLSSAIYSQDVNATAIAERDLDTGLVYINASTIGAEIQLPFGGVKATGYGPMEAGGRGGALDMFTRWKVIYRDFSGRLQKAQITE